MAFVLIQPHAFSVTETFIRAQAQRLPGTTVLYGYPAQYLDRPVLSPKWWARAWRKLDRAVGGKPASWEMTRSLLQAFQQIQPRAVLAQYGNTGVHAVEACRLSGVPLVVHFHGFDVCQKDTLENYGQKYRALFAMAAALVVVSRPMEQALLNLGAPAEKIRLCPCGVDAEFFSPARPAEKNPPVFISVGRLVDKKGPHLTLLAFSKALKEFPTARLRLVGDGPLRGVCHDLVCALKMERAVTFLGELTPEAIRQELRGARGFIHHAVRAWDGDCEGTPVAILEASAVGLPVISTRHGGIPEAVIDGVSGHLVEEGDTDAMADRLLTFCRFPEAATEQGDRGRAHVLAQYSLDRQVGRLHAILNEAAAAGAAPLLDAVPHQNSIMVPVG